MLNEEREELCLFLLVGQFLAGFTQVSGSLQQDGSLGQVAPRDTAACSIVGRLESFQVLARRLLVVLVHQVAQAVPLELGARGEGVDVQVVLLAGNAIVVGGKLAVDLSGVLKLLGAVGNLSGEVARGSGDGANGFDRFLGFLQLAGLVQSVRLFDRALLFELVAALGQSTEGIVETVELEQGNNAGVLGLDVGL